MAVKPGYRQAPEHVRKRTDARLATLRERPKPVSAEWLERRYWGDRASCVDIGAEIGRDPKTVLCYLRHYGIPTRGRGAESSPGTFRPGMVSPFTGLTHSEATKAKLREDRKRSPNLPHLTGGLHWLHTVPRNQHPNWKGGVTPERQAFYASQEWKDAVKQVWARADARCERCGKDHRKARSRGTFHVHHIISFAVPKLRAEPSNLALLCKSCHRFVHSNKNTSAEWLGGSNGH